MFESCDLVWFAIKLYGYFSPKRSSCFPEEDNR